MFFVDDGINLEKDEKHTLQDERPEQESDRPEEGDAAQDRKEE